MPAANINVSFAELSTAADRLVAGRDEIYLRLGALQKQVDQLVTSGFVTDKTSGAFSASYQRFTRGARETVSGLDGLSAFLRGTAQTLAEVDQQLAARLAQ